MKLSQFLQERKVRDILGSAPKPLVEVSAELSVKHLYEVFSTNGINAVAVANDSQGKKQHLGWISRLDLLSYAIQSDSFQSIQKGDNFMLATAGSVLQSLTCKEPCRFIQENASLQDLMSQFISFGIKRLLVSIGTQTHAVTEIDFIAYLFFCIDDLLGFMDTKCEAIFEYLKLFPTTFETVNSGQSALLAFEKMVAHKRTALGVTNNGGALVGHVSASDFLGTKQAIADVHKSVLMYQKELKDASTFSQVDTWTVNPQFTTSQLLGKLLYFAIHQLWWIDVETMKPKQLVSCSGIISYINHFALSES